MRSANLRAEYLPESQQLRCLHTHQDPDQRTGQKSPVRGDSGTAFMSTDRQRIHKVIKKTHHRANLRSTIGTRIGAWLQRVHSVPLELTSVLTFEAGS